jgi:hypothetical protein
MSRLGVPAVAWTFALAAMIASPALGGAPEHGRPIVAARVARLRVLQHRRGADHLRPLLPGSGSSGSSAENHRRLQCHARRLAVHGVHSPLDAAGNPDFACTGTVVAPNVILTAGHCTVDETTGATLDPSGFGIFMGGVDWSDTTRRQLSLVTKVITNPPYNPTTDTSDAGLLVLSTPTNACAIPSPRPRTRISSSSQPGHSSQAGEPPTTAVSR